MTILEILLLGFPIVIGAFGGLYWILEHELRRPISFDAPSSKSEDKLSDEVEK
jgi:hypothetical protein